MELTKYLKTFSPDKVMNAALDYFLNFFQITGGIALLGWRSFIALLKYKPNISGFMDQLYYIGNKSLSIVLLTTVFTGMVLALQFSVGLARFGLKMYAGHIVGLSIVRELGPVLTSVMIAARVGSGIAAELGSMVVTEQVMAIEAMGANPLQKLVVPRLMAVIIAAPLLTIVGDLVGILGGMFVSVLESGVTPHFYLDQVWSTVNFDDFIHGVGKTVFFGYLIGIIACYEGLNTSGGTEGVGKSTTKTVVLASVAIFISDFFLTKLFIALG